MFLDERFPEDISEGAQGGPRYSTTRTEALNGRVKKNINWQYPLHSFDAAFGVRTFDDLHRVLNFFHIAEGAAHSFRYKDWFDYKSCLPHEEVDPGDQRLGTGDGVATEYQLIKTYTVGAYSKVRIISKPVLAELRVALDGVEQLATAYSVGGNGLITFDTAPGPGAIVSAGYEFDVPVSFDEDELPTNLSGYDNGDVSVVLTEERITG